MKTKHVKRCSTPYIVREMQIKTTSHYIPIRMANIWNTDNSETGEHMEQEKFLLTVGGNAK